jgi:hypothetical protein
VPGGQPFSTDILGILKPIISEAPCDILVFNERNFSEIRSILIVYFGNGDEYLLDYARMLNHTSGRKFYTFRQVPGSQKSTEILNNSGIPLVPVTGSHVQSSFLRSIDLILVAEFNWRTFEEKQNIPVRQFPSLLIIHKVRNGNRILSS